MSVLEILQLFDYLYVQIVEVGSVGKGFNRGVNNFYAHTTGVRIVYYSWLYANTCEMAHN